MNRREPHKSLLDDYCSQLGALLERRYTERALITSKEQAEAAAALAREAMRQAQAADRAKSQFLATMSHELRTPLNAIIGFSEVIQSAPGASGDIPAYAKYIHESGGQLLTMLNGVIELARIEAGRLTLEEQDVMFEEVLDVAVRASRKAAEEKSVTIVSGMVMERMLRLDLAKITQVFSNVLSNAIKFTAAGGSIDIDSDLTPEGGLVIWIRDTGQGIAAEDLERVLQPFGQLEDHLTRQNSGIGLGLPVARSLVRLHGGELTLTSELGVGTTVEISLPRERLRPLSAAAA
jgi:signal transduction histidine kinase